MEKTCNRIDCNNCGYTQTCFSTNELKMILEGITGLFDLQHKDVVKVINYINSTLIKSTEGVEDGN